MHFNIRFFNLNKLVIISGALAGVLVIIFWFWWGSNEINILNGQSAITVTNDLPKSNISGVSCDNYNRRPMAVMFSSDPETRPLSGLSKADIVFEMPVTPGGVTRMMAVFQCNEPGEIGSVRSAREDFIPLVAGLGAVLAHWGGEKEALKKLNSHIIDNVDAMVYENKYFYRKSGVRQPHNGFTDLDKLLKGSQELKYAQENNFSGYPHRDQKSSSNIINIVDSFFINYSFPFDIQWVYDRDKNIYRRSRGGKPEIDRNDGSQVEAAVIVIMIATSRFTNKDYLNVTVTGGGDAEVYQNGAKISGKWEKDASRLDSKLFFYDTEGKEIEFSPGPIWVEIVTD